MDEFDDGSELMVVRGAHAPGVCHQQDEHWPDALAAGADDVIGDLVDERDVGLQLAADDGIDGLHVGCDGDGDAVLGWGHGCNEWKASGVRSCALYDEGASGSIA